MSEKTLMMVVVGEGEWRRVVEGHGEEGELLALTAFGISNLITEARERKNKIKLCVGTFSEHNTKAMKASPCQELLWKF